MSLVILIAQKRQTTFRKCTDCESFVIIVPRITNEKVY